MNAESTVFRASRPAVVVAPGGEGARAASGEQLQAQRARVEPVARPFG